MTIQKNKAFWVFPNMKESIDLLPPRLRGQAWEMVVNYAFGDDNCERNCKNNRVLFVFRALKPLIRLRGIAGSQNGKSNNPSGLSKKKQPNIGANIAPNIGANPLITETETITNNKEIYKESFDRFWSIYPKQRAGSKDKAYNSFCKAIKDKRATEEQIIHSAELYAKSDEVKRGFAKGCAAWLNDDRFNNNYTKEREEWDEGYGRC